MNADQYEASHQQWRYEELRKQAQAYGVYLWWLGFALGVTVGITVAVLWRTL
jgi:hypothetical protein